MGLTDLVLPTETVVVAEGQEFTVRGLSFADVTPLVARYGGEFRELFNSFIERATKNAVVVDENAAPHEREFAPAGLTAQDTIEVLTEGLDKFPKLIGELIAVAADSTAEDYEKAVAMAARLRPAVQLDALQKMFSLTFVSETEMGKFGEIVNTALESFIKAMNGENPIETPSRLN